MGLSFVAFPWEFENNSKAAKRGQLLSSQVPGTWELGSGVPWEKAGKVVTFAS